LETKGTVDVGDDETKDVAVDLLTIGAANVNAFAGMNGGTADALGLSLAGVDFALALAAEKTPAAGATKRSWATLKAEADGASFTGIEGMTIGAQSLDVEINRSAADGSLVDYGTNPLEIATGPASSISLDMEGSEGQLLRVSGSLDINLFNFFSVNGSFALEKSVGSVKVVDTAGTTATGDDTTTDVSVDLLTLGGDGIGAFAGMNGGTSDAIGLNLGMWILPWRCFRIGVTPRAGGRP
jgi:hypothetical protein